MRYDTLGFPIPPEFDGPDPRGAGRRDARPPGRRAGPGRGKRMLIVGLLAAVIGPGLVVPAALPVVREAVVQWSLRRAFVAEARGLPAAAIGDLGRALAWSGRDATRTADLLCWRAMLRLDALDPTGAEVDASRAIDLEPAASRPRRVRAIVNVVLAKPDAALADAEAAVERSPPADPEALNHRAYVRALVRRDLAAALADVDSALADGADASPDLLDTRGFVLHLLGRHQEAIDQLNLAIAGAEGQRRDVLARVRQENRVGVAREIRSLDRGLAVMHHHRGLACRAAGLEGQAEQDLAIAEQKGYDPSRGVL